MKKTALAFCALLVCLSMAELALRTLAPLNPTIYRIDDVYLHRLIPNARKTFTHDQANGNARVEVKINSLGFRDVEFSIAPAAGKKRIVVYGDSFIEAEFTPLERSFTKRLEHRLNAGREGSFEVVNAGVVAYGPDQISLRVNAETDELKPSLVVVAVFAGNDFGDLLRNKIYRLNPDGELFRNAYTISPALRNEFKAPGRSALLNSLRRASAFLRARFRGRTLEESPNRETYIERSVRRCREQYVDYVLEGNNEVKDLLRDQYDADISLKTDAQAALYKKRLMERTLVEIKRTLDARGVPLVLLIIPAAMDAVPDYEVSIDRSIYRDYEASALTDAVREAAIENGIPHVNLFDAFTTSDAPALLYLKYPNAHWSEDGQELAARLLDEYVRGQSLLP